MSEKTSGLTVLQAGVQSSLQDLGRFGCADQGLSQGGAVDLHAHCWANKLLENDMDAATLEVAIGMAKFRAETDLQLAIAGADMQAQVDGSLIGNWRSFPVKCGQILTLKAAQQGIRAYLAVAGGFIAETYFGSVSAVPRNQVGDFIKDGGFLTTGILDSQTLRQVPHRYIPEYQDSITLRIIESYQASKFDREQLDLFYRSEYILSQDTDRMGARLEGKPVSTPRSGIISEGIALGSIQIPPNGQPIILLNDRQTLGGYPKIGCVARIDLPKIAQARPGTKVQFVPIGLEQARREWLDFRRWFND